MAKSADEVRAERLSVLGPEFGQVYHALCDEVQWLYVKWHEYRKPYATSRERLDLLNSAAPFFFRVVQDVLWDDALLHLARLTDHPKSAGKPNMTVRRLAGVVSDPRLAAEVEHLVGYAVRLCEFARETRHRHLGPSRLRSGSGMCRGGSAAARK